jgi:hypothetical protein
MKLKYIALFSLLLLSLLSVLPVIAQTEEKFEYNNEWNDFDIAYGINWFSQTFTPQISHKLSKVVLYGFRIGEPIGDFIVSIRKTDGEGKPTGGDLVVKSVLASSIQTEEGEIEIVFDTQISLDANTKYAIVCRYPDGSPTNQIALTFSSENPYPQGNGAGSDNSGEAWIIKDYDFWFEEWGYREVALPPRRKPASAPPEELMTWFPLTFYVIMVILFFGGLYLYTKRELWLISIPLIPVIAWLLQLKPYPPHDFHIAIILAIIAVSLLLNKLREK